MGQKWCEFIGTGFSSAIDDFEIRVQGEALNIGRLDRERVREGQALIDARAERVREAVSQPGTLLRVVRLEGAEHAATRSDILATTLSAYQSLRPGQPRRFADGPVPFWAIRLGEHTIVWGAGAGEAKPEVDPATLPAGELHVFGAALEIGRERREPISFDEWANGEVVEATIDGYPVRLRRAGWRIQVWGAEDAELPNVARSTPLSDTGTTADYDIVVSGTAVNIARIDRSERERDPEAHTLARHAILRDSLARLHADRQPFGWRSRNKIDGIECEIRRDGWRLQVWGAGESEPAVDNRDPPEGADSPGEDVATARMAIADCDVHGNRIRKALPPTPEQVTERRAILERLSQAQADRDEEAVAKAQAEFVATHKFAE